MISLQNGQLIAGRYRLDRALARGGMGSVWVARHLQLDVDVAVKFMARELTASPEARARFEHEARASAHLKSPNVVQVHDYGVEDETPFLVMELLEGEPLEARLVREGRLSCADTAAVLVPVCRALRRAHEAELVHRDLKPDNIFLASSGDEVVPKVLDFGIAKHHEPGAAGSSTKTGALLGTPHYMSPEQVRKSSAVDHRSDLWSMGVIAFRCLTGALPFPGDEIGEVLVAICAEPIPRASELCEGLGPEVDQFFDRALARDLAQRFQSARDLAEALAALGGEVLRPSLVVSMRGADLAPARGPAVSDPALAPPAGGAPAEGEAPPLPPTATSPRPRRAPLLALAGVIAVALGLVAARGRSSVSPAPPVAAAPGCAGSRACTEKIGHPAICRAEDGACVALESEDCRLLAGPHDVEDDATVWFGAMFPAQGGAAAINAVDLARRDFASTTGGLLPARPGGPKRPLGVVLCDDASTASATRAAQHLVDLRVPALLGFARSKEVLDLAHSHLVPAGTLALAANMASSLRDVPRGPGGARLVWRIAVSVDIVVPALAAVLAEVVEPDLRGGPPGDGGARTPAARGGGEPLRVTLLRAGNTTGQSYADLLVSTLRFNGKSVAENGDAFREVVADPAGRDAGDKHAAEVVALRPRVVIVAGASPEIVSAVERLWPAGEARRPRYLLAGSLGHPALLSSVEERPDLAARILGVSTTKSSTALAKFVLHYNDTFSPKVTAHDAEAAPYDGFYLLAYATAALGDKPITGAALAGVFPRLLPTGDRIDVGPGGIYPALDALATSKTIDLEGASTSLDLDPETGDAAADLAVEGIAADGHGVPPRAIDAGLVYRTRTGVLEGALRR